MLGKVKGRMGGWAGGEGGLSGRRPRSSETPPSTTRRPGSSACEGCMEMRLRLHLQRKMGQT